MKTDSVYNRALFNKSSGARDKLRQMGGVDTLGQGAPSMPKDMGGIMASSPELMQSAMRGKVVLPVQQQPMGQQPMMAPPMAPSRPAAAPLPNIAGIAPVTSAPAAVRPPQAQPAPQPMAPAPAPAPRPMAPAPAQRPVKRLAEGGAVSVSPGSRGRSERRGAGINYKQAQGVANQALTSQNPEDLGLPPGATELIKDPEAAAAEITNRYLPEDEKSGDLVKDVRKVAQASGISDIPATASLDDLNRAIVGAKLGAGIAGDVVNPNTGQALRPTAGKRIAGAVAEGLMAPRETAANREEMAQQAQLAREQLASNERIAGMRAAGGGGGEPGMKLSPLEPYQDALRDLAGKILTANYGMSADEAFAQARAALGSEQQYYGATQSQPPPGGGGPTLEQFLDAAQKANPDASVEDLTTYYNTTYGG